MRASLFSLAVVAALLCPAPPLRAADPVRLLIDTDIGDEFDDALALAMLLAHPNVEIGGITTTQGDAFTRALILCRMLHAIDRADIPVAAGSKERPTPVSTGQMQYGLRPCFRKRPVKEDAVTFLYQKLKAQPGRWTILALGPLTNIADLLCRHPDCRRWIHRIVIMGGALEVGYNGKPPVEPEWNIKQDVAAARSVLASGIELSLVPVDVTWNLNLPAADLAKILHFGSMLTHQLKALRTLWHRDEVTLFDPLATLVCVDETCCKWKPMRLMIDDHGVTKKTTGKANVRVAVEVNRKSVLSLPLALLTKGKSTPNVQLKATNPAKPIPRGNHPNRVHVCEDYDTDIERRWWLSGRLVEKIDGGTGRVCQGVACDDFDDRMGNRRGLYTAVIFNPVPGPPMGKQTRLSFRCKLEGTSLLRVQIYSLSRGYHRHLTLTEVPQGRWVDLTVDMTQARKPDGTGGPLSEDERIDDIQFYTNLDAKLWIDNIVLYDEAPASEKRPFPERFLFTGWFDTGRQGKEWPGTYQIVAHEKPRTWKAARSVVEEGKRNEWLRLNLRGSRPVKAGVELQFKYRLKGAKQIQLILRSGKKQEIVELKDLAEGKWSDKLLLLPLKQLTSVADVIFRLLPGATLEIDDVLLYQSKR